MRQKSIQKPTPYYEQFYHSLKKMIFEGELQPGERINETQLSKEFNVSKSPIREAVRTLEREGLLVFDEKNKIVVYEPTGKDIEEIYECRQALESFGVKFVVERASDEQMMEIGVLLSNTKQAIQDKKPAHEIIAMNEEFHQKIIEFSQNDRLKKHINELKSLMHLFRIYNFTGINRALVIWEEHHRIFQKMNARKGNEAAEAMIEHLNCDIVHLKEVLAMDKKSFFN
ncbi:GntR family transcriptional regulator [Alteribacillus sp. HJP-4]|uniref:GntR family transcriptional regulator n=1 Tax=Alteribacillus sp. HJP-4 TaxID=2775394 RepID=UPI0035CD118C